MRSFPLILLLFFLVFKTTAQQLTLVPQVGVQFVKSKLEYSTFPGINSRYRHLNPYIGARLMYEGKNGHGLFAGIANGAVGYSYELFYPADASMNNYDRLRSSKTSGLWRFEIGYHWNSKPVYFKKVWDNHQNGDKVADTKQKGWSVRIQPLIGAACQLINDEGAGWTEHTLNGVMIREDDIPMSSRRNFALIAGLGFEFGKNDKRKFTLSFNYIRGLGNSIDRSKLTINTGTGNYYGLLGSNGTGFNMTVGVPIRIWRKKR